MSASYHVYGNTGSGGPVDYSTPLAAVAGTSWPTPPLAPGSSWRFAVRAFDPSGGLEEVNVDAAVSITLDAGGHDATDRPIAPLLVTATAVAGGGVRVDWHYPVAAARAAWRPTGFRVYVGTPSAGFATPAATTPYAPAANFRATLSGLTAGSNYAVVVRAYNGSGEEGNTNAASVTPAASGPSPVVGLAATVTARIGDGR